LAIAAEGPSVIETEGSKSPNHGEIVTSETLPPFGEAEKRRVAFTSVLAAIFLTSFKIVVGVMTGSLGILAEAVHSGLDLVASVVTFVAVHFAGKPADENHLYGHGKIESFSALFETILLFVTCGWIIYEGIERLFFHPRTVQPSIWAFVVMGVSMLIDFGRSTALRRVAQKYKSQALEADALHFSTDIWSSVVVLFGLFLVKAADWFPASKEWLTKADALAAMGVAVIVFWVSWQLVKSTLDVLLDRAPHGFAEEVKELAQGIPGVVDCRRVRVRHVGPTAFIDLVIDVPRTMPLERAHGVSDELEEMLVRRHPQADVVVHFEPVAIPEEDWTDRVQAVAGEMGHYVHDVRVHLVDDKRIVYCHLEVDPMLSLSDAHDLADRIEDEIKNRFADVDEVNTHIEGRADMVNEGEPAEDARPAVEALLKDSLKQIPGLSCHDVRVYRESKRLVLALHCDVDGKNTVYEAHRLTSQLEEALRQGNPSISRVQIHIEPC
jgi:cation diffusion facilitator family transporter